VIRLEHCLDAEAWALWQAGHRDDAWPVTKRSHANFKAFLQDCNLAEFLGSGGLFAIRSDNTYIGYTYAQHVFKGWMTEEAGAMEWGTYLLPAYRARGLNVGVKLRQLTYAFDTVGIDWCVYVIPKSNVRAQRAMRKLTCFSHAETDEMVPPVIQKFERYRSWTIGEACNVFYVHRSDARFAVTDGTESC